MNLKVTATYLLVDINHFTWQFVVLFNEVPGLEKAKLDGKGLVGICPHGTKSSPQGWFNTPLGVHVRF